MGNFRKNILQTDFEEKNSCKEIPGENNSFTEKNIYLSWHIIMKKNWSYTVYVKKKKFYHQRFEEKRFLPKSPISIAPLKSQMVGPLAGAVTAFACGKINECFGFWFKKLSKSNSYRTTVEQTKVYWRTDSYAFEGKKVCDTSITVLSGPFNLPWSQHLSYHSLTYHPASYHDAINVVRLFKPL